jgi:Zn finger protein HypA/HybF involved in hydrogenase expression
MAHKVKNEKRIVLVCLVCGCTWTPRTWSPRKRKKPLRLYGVRCPNCKSNRIIIDIEEVKTEPPKWIPI